MQTTYDNADVLIFPIGKVRRLSVHKCVFTAPLETPQTIEVGKIYTFRGEKKRLLVLGITSYLVSRKYVPKFAQTHSFFVYFWWFF